MILRCITASFQSRIPAGGQLPGRFTVHSIRVGGSLGESLAGTTMDELVKLGGWKTESVTEHYIGLSTGEAGKPNGASFIALMPPRTICRWRQTFCNCLQVVLNDRVVVSSGVAVPVPAKRVGEFKNGKLGQRPSVRAQECRIHWIIAARKNTFRAAVFPVNNVYG